VCPQFTAIDSQLTVREHLAVYARLKGLRRGGEVESNATALMAATGLDQYADRLASKLSGGNQRKLALAIALIGGSLDRSSNESPDFDQVIRPWYSSTSFQRASMPK